MAALALQVEQAAPFVEVGRRLKFYTDVADLPAAYVITTHNEYRQHGTGFLPIRSIAAEIWIYAQTDPMKAPGLSLNPVLDAVEQALAPTGPDNTQTLGGLVVHCWIGGDDNARTRIEIWEGHLGDVAAAIVPVTILIP